MGASVFISLLQYLGFVYDHVMLIAVELQLHFARFVS